MAIRSANAEWEFLEALAEVALATRGLRAGALRAARILAVAPLLCGSACALSGPAPEVPVVEAPAPGGLASVGEAPAGVDLAALQRSIAEREYEVSENRRGLQAPNRRHGLRSYFGETGVRVHDRREAGQAPLLTLELRALRRGDREREVGPGLVRHEGARVEIERPGLLEWYTNSPAGLEQGFELRERLQGEAPLWLELALENATARQHGDAVEIETQAGRRLRYAELKVVDARGRAVSATLEVPASSQIRLVIDDATASYPVTIDPLLTSTFDTQLESDQANANLGLSVSGAGDVNRDGFADVIVGAPSYDAGSLEEGAAFVFLGGVGGIANGSPATAAAQLESDQVFGRMGESVSGAGDVNGDGYDDVIVGAPDYDAGAINGGAAFVFLGGAAGIVDGSPATAAAQLESDQAFALLGRSVSGAGDVNGDGYADVIVGAPIWDAGSGVVGAAFVFLGGAAGIADGSPATAAAQLVADQANADMGYSVSGAGDVNADGYADVVVGARSYDAGSMNEGAAFVFLGGAGGIANGSSATAATQLESDQTNANLGESVSGAGDVNGDGYADVIVGARGYDAGSGTVGAAFVFLGGAGGIADGSPATAAAQLESDQANADLGRSVSGAGDVNLDGYADVIVGAPRYDAGSNSEGVAFVFLGGAAGIVDGSPATAAAQLESDQAFAGLGESVSGAGDVNGDGYADVIVGAPFFDAGAAFEGAAFVFLGGAVGIVDGSPATAGAQVEADQAQTRMGESVSGAGDVNGDGYADVIVGVPLYDAGSTDEGAAFVFLGGAGGIANGSPATAAAQLESDQAGAELGESVSGAGDVNGDGFADVIVGAPFYDAGSTDEGAAFVFLGGAGGIANGSPATAAAQLESDQANARLGGSVSGVGDVNGDGYADVIVGAERYDAGSAFEGAAFVFLGGAGGIVDGSPATANAQLESDQEFALLGESVSGAGDVNGDGYADVIVGARYYDAGSTDEGAAFVFLGGAGGIADGSPATAAAQLEADQANSELGRSVSGAGDVNADGYADVVVGAPFYDAGSTDEGAAFVFLGGAGGIADGSPATAAAQLESDQVGAALGFSVSGAGDVNGDGYADVIVGAPTYDAGSAAEGAAFVFLGGTGGIVDGSPATASAQLESDQVSVQLGLSISGAGDVNGDGHADVIVGAPLYDDGEMNEGAAFVFLGNSGVSGRLVQARPELAGVVDARVAPWGYSGAADALFVAMEATSSGPNGLVKLEVEACPAGVAFADAACSGVVSAAWTETGPSGSVTLRESISGLAPDTLYQWRARTLHEPIVQPGITPPLGTQGPWRRPGAAADAADIRIGVPEPGLGVSLVLGLALLGGSRKNKRRFPLSTQNRNVGFSAK